MSPGTSSDSGGDLHPRVVFLRALNALDTNDRTAVCDYVFNNEPDLKKFEICSTVRYQASRLVDRLAEFIRFDSDVDPGPATRHLYDEARDWIVWTGGFSIAQEEVEVRYDMVRGCERWARGEFTIKNDRPVLSDFCTVLERNIADLQPMPTPGPVKVLPLYEPRTMHKALAVMYYLIAAHFAIFGAIAYRAGQDIQCMRERARQWVLLWKALLALAQDMLTSEDPDEGRRHHLLRIFDCVDKRYMHASWDSLPLIIAVDRAPICQVDRDALAGAIVARLLPYFKHRVEVSGSVWGYSDVIGSDLGELDVQSQLQLDLHYVLGEACAALGVVDPLFKFLGIGQYVHKSCGCGQGYFSARPRYTHSLWDTIPRAIDALWYLKSRPGIFNACVEDPFTIRNMHMRLAWVGGLGRAQHDIVAQIALARRDPSPEQVQRLVETIEHHLTALGTAPVVPFRDLLSPDDTEKKTLVLVEILKCLFFVPLCLLLAAIPRIASTYLDFAVLFVYALGVITLLSEFGRPVLVGLCDYVHAYRGSVEAQRAHTAAAQLEYYARYHLVGWTALLRVLRSGVEPSVADAGPGVADTSLGVAGFALDVADPSPDNAERVAAVREALFENITASASLLPISMALELVFYKLCGSAVPDLVDKHYPHFRGAA
ncbi:hypothetical protein K523DRAFT_332351 [Schizophyllum commune Tattone D]|nr:hypothetical protein K523DRAFT_332351 [Schizophyllum commune Tattone D]